MRAGARAIQRAVIPPSSIRKWLAKSAPKVAAEIGRADILYCLCQIVGLTVATKASARLQPFTDYREVKGEEPGLTIENERIRVFVGPGADLTGTRITGTSRGAVFIGADSVVRNCVLELNAERTVFALGYSSVVLSSLFQTLPPFGLFSIAPGLTFRDGGDLFIHEGGHIAIGEDCMFSTDIAMRTSDSHGLYDIESGKRINLSVPITVHRHVWLSRQAAVNKGAVIEEDVVVGFRSLASGLLKARSVYAGWPARQVRKNTTWDRAMIPAIDAGYDQAQFHYGANFAANRAAQFGRTVTQTGLAGFSEALAMGLPFDAAGDPIVEEMIALATKVRPDWGSLRP